MTKPKPKPEIWWTIKHPDGRLLIWFVAIWKKRAVYLFDQGDMFTSWASARKAGYRAVKIKVSEV